MAVDKNEKEKDSKLKALQMTLDRLDKTYGKGTVMRLGEKQVLEVETISTGSIGLDVGLNFLIGGLRWPRPTTARRSRGVRGGCAKSMSGRSCCA